LSVRESEVGTGLGVVGLGCVLLVGSSALAGLLVCGGVARSVWRGMPEVVVEEPLLPAPGTWQLDRPPEPVRRPRPVGPRPPRPPKPAPPPDPLAFDVESESLLVASIAVAGDPMLVLAIDAEGTAFPLPGELPRGRYALEVTFAGRAPFEAGAVTVLDASPQTVTCRSSLAICKVQ
jgi:hypothetical protein